MSETGTRRAAAFCRMARVESRRAPLSDLAAFFAAMICSRVAPAAPTENNTATAASAAMADFLAVILFPELC